VTTFSYTTRTVSPARQDGKIAVKEISPLFVQKNRIVDRNLYPVLLRGVSLFWSQWQPDFFSFETLRWLRDDWGITAIRAPLGVHHDGYLDNPARERRKIETVVAAAIELGLYVIVDWHAHHSEAKQAAGFFSEIARTYGRFPNLIYEPWNEPAGQYSWPAIKLYHAQVIEQIRAWDPQNLVIAATPNWCRDVDIAANDPLSFENIAYALHFYAASHGQALRDKAQRALNMGTALVATEWGTCKDNGDGPLNRREVARWLKFMEKNGIGHINWSVSKRDESSAILNKTAQAKAGWSKADMSVSGRLVRRNLRRGAFPFFDKLRDIMNIEGA
jgi:endoglucanase